MEHFAFSCYNVGYETPWIPRGTGEAPSTCHRPAERGQGEPFGCSTLGGRIKKLCLSLVSGIPERGLQGPSFEGDSWASSQTSARREGEVSGVASNRSPGRGIPDRPLDVEADRPDRPETLWDSVSSQSCLAPASGDGMELPKTGASGFTKERERGRPLETVSVAPYKKTPKDLGPIWSSSMSPASCLFPTYAAPGLQKDKPRSSITFTNKTGFLPSVLCRCPLRGSIWLSISDFGRVILRVWMSAPSLKSCSSISGDRWCCCGIGLPFTGAMKSSSFSLDIQEFIWNISRLMPLNLIQQNMFGIRPTVLFPTVHRRTWRCLKRCYEIQYDGSGDHKGSFGHVSMLPISHGLNKSFHYLCENQ